MGFVTESDEFTTNVRWARRFESFKGRDGLPGEFVDWHLTEGRNKMGAPETAFPGRRHPQRDDGYLRVNLDPDGGRRGPPVVSGRPLQVFPSTLMAFHSDPEGRVQLSPGYRAPGRRDGNRLVAWARDATQRRAPRDRWQLVRGDCAAFLATSQLSADVDGEIESMAGRRVSICAVGSQMESDVGGRGRELHWERRAMRMSENRGTPGRGIN